MPPTDYRPAYLALSEREGVVIAAVKLPQLTEEENIDQLGQELFALVDQFGHRQVIVDLKSVEYTTSSVLGKIISLHRKLHRNGGKLVLCNVQGAVLDVLRTSRLIDYFHVEDNLEGALAAFNGG